MGVIMDDGDVKIDRSYQTNVPGLFAAGDCVGGVLQIAKAVADGAIAGLNISEFLAKRTAKGRFSGITTKAAEDDASSAAVSFKHKSADTVRNGQHRRIVFLRIKLAKVKFP